MIGDKAHRLMIPLPARPGISTLDNFLFLRFPPLILSGCVGYPIAIPCIPLGAPAMPIMLLGFIMLLGVPPIMLLGVPLIIPFIIPGGTGGSTGGGTGGGTGCGVVRQQTAAF
jgi:hypothetical protein